MSPCGPELAKDVLDACRANVGEMAEALTRAVGKDCSLDVHEDAGLDLAKPPDSFEGPGLVLVLKVESAAVLVLIPESTGILPDWYQDPDETGRSKLATLAQELGISALPEQCMPTDFFVAACDQLGATIEQAGMPGDAALVALDVEAGEAPQSIYLAWPAVSYQAVVEQLAGPDQAQVPEASDAESTALTGDAPAGLDLSEAPGYLRSLFRVKVPLVVTLASKREKVSRILEIGPGAIIQFEKSCEDTLDLDVGAQRLAAGEAVKVGDKFGLRITSIVLPGERFLPVSGSG